MLYNIIIIIYISLTSEIKISKFDLSKYGFVFVWYRHDINVDSWSSRMTEQYKNNIGQSSWYCTKDIEYADLLYH